MNRWIGLMPVLLMVAAILGCGGAKDKKQSPPPKVALTPAERWDVETSLGIARLAIQEGRMDDAAEELDLVAERMDRLPEDLKNQVRILQAACKNAGSQEDVPTTLPSLPSSQPAGS